MKSKQELYRQFLTTGDELKNICEHIGTIKKQLIDLALENSKLKSKFISQANEEKTENGKKKYSNAELRENFILMQTQDHKSFQQTEELKKKLIGLETKKEGVEFIWRSYKTVIENLEFLG